MSMSGWCSSSSATSDTAFTKSMASAKSSNSKVRSMCFFSSSHSGMRFMRSLSSGAFIKSAITGERVTPENCFATPKRVGLIGQDFLKIFCRIEEFNRAAARFPRTALPVCQCIFNSCDSAVQIPYEMETTLAWQIFSRVAVFGNHRPTGREKRGGSVAQPAGFPTHVHAFDGGEFARRAGNILPIFRGRMSTGVRIGKLPAAFSQTFAFRIVRVHVHGELKARRRHEPGQIEILLECV